jgi:hypothetical protein
MKYPNTLNGKTYQGSFIFGVDLINEMGEENDDQF